MYNKKVRGLDINSLPQSSADPHACMCAKLLQFRFFVTLWTIAHQAPLSMGFSWQEYWSGLPYLSPGDLLNSIIDAF